MNVELLGCTSPQYQARSHPNEIMLHSDVITLYKCNFNMLGCVTLYYANLPTL